MLGRRYPDQASLAGLQRRSATVLRPVIGAGSPPSARPLPSASSSGGSVRPDRRWPEQHSRSSAAHVRARGIFETDQHPEPLRLCPEGEPLTARGVSRCVSTSQYLGLCTGTNLPGAEPPPSATHHRAFPRPEPIPRAMVGKISDTFHLRKTDISSIAITCDAPAAISPAAQM